MREGTTVRDEFLEPLPSVQTDATLLFGATPVSCHIVSVSDEGFCVAVPGVERYEGDPRLNLATEKGIFPVRLVLQEAHVDGFSYRLVRAEFKNRADNNQGPDRRLRNNVTSICLAGMVAATLAVCLCLPSINDAKKILSLVGIGHQSASLPLPVINGDHSPQQMNPDDLSTSIAIHSHHVPRDKKSERTAFAVSMISPATMSVSSSSMTTEATRDVLLQDQQSHENGHRSHDVSHSPGPQSASLRDLLEQGQIGRIQSVTKSLIPWMFGSAHDEESLSIRISDAALLDLKQFEAGLRSLPKQSAADAISSLKRTLQIACTDFAKSHVVECVHNLRVIASADANVYFKIVRGRMELVRVLPLEFGRDE